MELRALFLVLNQRPYEADGIAFEATPRTLAQNCGVNVVRAMTALQGKKKQPPGSEAPSKPQVETEGDADNEQMIPENRSDGG
ncbi:hypothetical protein TB2_036235 [Malus domestica]